MTSLAGLARSSHPLPGLAVTALTTVLALSVTGPTARVLVIAVAVLSGQLVVGWTNDIVDRHRDAESGRTDKPIAVGTVSPIVASRWALASTAVCVAASLSLGWIPGALHLMLGVGAALAYNVALKSTVMSWLPYTVAFGALPVVVYLAGDGQTAGEGQMPPTWMVVVGALLGFGAHLVNVLPDLADDDATGVRGFPHRLPPRAVAPIAATVLLAASVVGIAGSGSERGWFALPVVLVLAVVACVGSGKVPFYSAVAIAGVDVAVLVAG